MSVCDENDDGPWSVPCEARDFVAWHQGCRWCAVWVLMLDAPSVVAPLAQALRHARARLGPALLPRYTRQPHVSVAYRGLCQSGGHPAQEFDAAQLRADVQRLQALSPAPFTLQVAGAASFETVPYLALAEDAGAAALHALHACLQLPPPPDVADDPLSANWRFVPHVTVGHYAQRLRLSQAVQQMGLANWQAPRMAVTQLALVRYASADIAGPLTLEGCYDLLQQRYTPAATALWPTLGAAQPHAT